MSALIEGLGIYEIAMGLGWVAAVILALRPVYDRVMTWRLQASMTHLILLDTARLEDEVERLSKSLVDCMAESARIKGEMGIDQKIDRDLSETLSEGGDKFISTIVDQMVEVFSESELEMFLVLSMEVDSDLVGGENLMDRSFNVVQYFMRRGKVSDLLGSLAESRPHVTWGIPKKGK